MTDFPVVTSAESVRLSATDTKTICIVVLFVSSLAKDFMRALLTCCLVLDLRIA